MKFEKGDIFIAKEEFIPLYRKGDRFRIVKINRDKGLLPIEALHLRTGNVYGFYRDEVVTIENKTFK